MTNPEQVPPWRPPRLTMLVGAVVAGVVLAPAGVDLGARWFDTPAMSFVVAPGLLPAVLVATAFRGKERALCALIAFVGGVASAAAYVGLRAGT